MTKPLYFTLQSNLKLMMIPDTHAHLDGHTIITQTYSIFENKDLGNPLVARSKESTLHLEQINDPDYFGYIKFEKPDFLFSYTADGQQELSPEEVTELVEHLSDVRDNPALWSRPEN